jgi:arginine deiminase
MVNNKPYFERVLEVREAQQKHQELLEAMGKKTELEQDADVYDIGDDNIPSNIKEELESIEAVITNLRDWFDGRYDDIVGIEVEDDWEIEGEFHSG